MVKVVDRTVDDCSVDVAYVGFATDACSERAIGGSQDPSMSEKQKVSIVLLDPGMRHTPVSGRAP